MSKILILDIETAPNVAYVWGAWKQNIGHNQWRERSHIMSYAAKWLDSEDIMYEDNRKDNDRRIVKQLYDLLHEADVVVAHNGKRFDIPVIIGRGVVHGFTPPSPFYTVDTFQVARKELRLSGNSLKVLCDELGLPQKEEHKKFPGFELWLECLKGNAEAWEEMREYNIQDIISLEALYLRLRPYMKNHPNVGRFMEDMEVLCPKCESDDIQWRGYYYTKAGLCYKRFQCQCCGGWGRYRYSEKDVRVNNGRNAV